MSIALVLAPTDETVEICDDLDDKESSTGDRRDLRSGVNLFIAGPESERKSEYNLLIP